MAYLAWTEPVASLAYGDRPAGRNRLAQAFQGIHVCVRPWKGGVNFHDANSGFSIKHGGYQYLSPPQALAFVRERDNLPSGDIDRTRRQQAVIDYVIWKLEHGGVLSDLRQLNGLLDVAKQYVITDADWDIPLFATEMHALTGKNLSFQTAPVTGYATIDGQDANVIDIPTIQRQVGQAFTDPGTAGGKSSAAKTAPAPPPSTVTVDVYNGGDVQGLATRVSTALVGQGTRPAPSATRRPSPGRPGRRPRSSTARGRRRTRRRSPATSASPRPRARRCPPGMSKSCLARPPVRCPSPSAPRRPAALVRRPGTPAVER